MADTLQQWAREGKLAQAKLSSDGRSLTLEGGGATAALDASQECNVTVEDKSCRYTLASLFLQVLDPDQSLVAYRSACKTHSVSDPVKALDKPLVMGYILLGTAQELPSGEAAAATPPAAAVAARESSKAEHRSSSDRDRHRHKKHRSKHHHDKHERSSKHHHSRDSSSASRKRPSGESERSSTDKKKKRKTPITNEQLFSNLNVVVDKRTVSLSSKETEDQIHKALSAEGFEVTPELLEEHKASLEKILPLETPVGNSASILRPTTLEGRDFGRVLDLYLETTKPSSSSLSKHSKSRKSPTMTTANSSSSTTKQYLIGKKPVIVLPKGMATPVTMVNAMELFANSRFVPRELAKRTTTTTFARKVGTRLGGGVVEYELMDNPKAKLGEDPREWQRIVAVIAMGASWQFKDWPAKYSNPVHLFSRTYGFFISMEGDKIPKELEGWAVRRGKLNRDKRGLDSVTYASFWNGLDEWMAVHKPELLPQRQH